MATYGSVRVAVVGLGSTYLIAVVLLAELLGASADATATFTKHFDDDVSRFGDIAGGTFLLAAALFLTCSGLTLRHHLAAPQPSLRIDLVAALAVIAAVGFLVAAGLLLAPPVTQSLGDLTGDPGIEPNAAAGLAQAGTVLFLCSLIIVGAWTALVAHVARSVGAVGGLLSFTAWVVATLTLLGVTVVAALPLGCWWIVFGFKWNR